MSLFVLFAVTALPLLAAGADILLPDVPDCAKPGFWKSVKSPACALLYEYQNCDGDAVELPIGSESNGTAKSAAIRPGCHLYEGRREVLNHWDRSQYWNIDDGLAHEVHCKCFTKSAELLTCQPSEEWVLLATLDNRRHSAPALFEYIGFANSLVGTNGTITDSNLATGILRVLQYHGFDTAFLGTDLRTSDKVVVPPSSCAFVLQQAYKCGPVHFMRWNVQIRIQGPGSTDGATEECNLGDAQTTDASV